MEWLLEKGPRAPSIGGTAFAVGAAAFALGFFGALVFYPESNLGPLLGIFITGPVGFLVGALFGVVLFARAARDDALRRELTWLAAMWAFSLLYTFIFAWGWGWVGMMMQTAAVATAAYVFYGKSLRPLPRRVISFRAPLLVAGVVSLLASLFPPIVAKGDDQQQRFAFFLDPRFDARYEVPEFSVDSLALALEWLFFIVIALAIGFAMLATRNKRAS
jgi:hypothetical protein